MATASITITTVDGRAASVPSGGILQLNVRALNSDGTNSGARVSFVSSNTAVAKMSAVDQIGAAPEGVIGVAAGTATITGTASDASVTGTLVVTVT